MAQATGIRLLGPSQAPLPFMVFINGSTNTVCQYSDRMMCGCFCAAGPARARKRQEETGGKGSPLFRSAAAWLFCSKILVKDGLRA